MVEKNIDNRVRNVMKFLFDDILLQKISWTGISRNEQKDRFQNYKKLIFCVKKALNVAENTEHKHYDSYKNLDATRKGTCHCLN